MLRWLYVAHVLPRLQRKYTPEGWGGVPCPDILAHCHIGTSYIGGGVLAVLEEGDQLEPTC